jgi:hypothetical protein
VGTPCAYNSCSFLLLIYNNNFADSKKKKKKSATNSINGLDINGADPEAWSFR